MDTTTLPRQHATERRLIAAGISAAAWLYGIVVLRWDIDEVQLFFCFDMFLFMCSAVLKVTVSMDRKSDFFAGVFWRLWFGLLIGVLGFKMVAMTAHVSLFAPGTFTYVMQSPARWAYACMLLNYIGYFVHDYMYSGYYKVSNPFVEGFTDFFCMFITGIVIGLMLNFSDFESTALYFRLYAVGVVVGRFGCELFLAFKGKTFFANNDPEHDPN